MGSDMRGKGHSEIIKGDKGAALRGKLEQALAQGEFVGCDIPTEQDDRAPVDVE
ncbi:MAG: hypothetical protein NVS2B7_31430 [Herpetosiphon sp.]